MWIERQIGVLPKMSPASTDSNASLTRKMFFGPMKKSRMIGLVTR